MGPETAQPYEVKSYKFLFFGTRSFVKQRHSRIQDLALSRVYCLPPICDMEENPGDHISMHCVIEGYLQGDGP